MGFRIDGSDYEIPEFDTFTMGEAMVLYDHTKLSLDDFVADEDDPKQAEALRKNVLHPGTVLTRMIVAYMRANPGQSRDATEKLIEGSNWLASYSQYLAQFRGDVSPPDEMPEDSSSESEPSGQTSKSGSDEPGEIPEPTGTSE